MGSHRLAFLKAHGLEKLGNRIWFFEGKPEADYFYPHQYFQFCGGARLRWLPVMFGVYERQF